MTDEINTLEVGHFPEQVRELVRGFHGGVYRTRINQEIEPVEETPIRIAGPEGVAEPALENRRINGIEDSRLGVAEREVGIGSAAVTVVEPVNEHEALASRLRVESAVKDVRREELPAFDVPAQVELEIRLVALRPLFVLTHFSLSAAQ